MSTTVVPPSNDTLPPAPDANAQAVQRMQGELARKNQEIDALKRQVFAPPANPQPPAPAPMDKDKLDREFLKNPVQYANAIALAAVQNANAQQTAATLDTHIAMAKDLVRKGREELFDRYEGEITTLIKASVEPHLHGNVNVWQNAYRQVIGSHTDEIVAAAREPKGNGNSPAVIIRPAAGNGPAAPSAPQQPAPAKETLSADEIRYARKLGITPEQYAQGKKDNEGQHDFVLDPVGKSSWDDHITFDTRDMRRKQRAARIAAQSRRNQA